MVLLNGIKYACERCIRGHRVTTCTHTDQPLTMIKPKGRPALQCQHCRELRKLKNAHVLCTCGKRGKGLAHSSSCLCHTTTHCTCAPSSKPPLSGQSIHHLLASEKAKRMSLISAANAEVKKKSSSSSSSLNQSNSVSPTTGEVASTVDYSISDFGTNGREDLPFGSLVNYDLFALPESLSDKQFPTFDYAYYNGSPLHSDALHSDGENGSAHLQSQDSDNSNPLTRNSSTNVKKEFKEEINMEQEYPFAPPQLSPGEFDIAESMFPLFPLVGQYSFDDDKLNPLLLIPKTEPKAKVLPTSSFAALVPTLGLSHKKLIKQHQPKPLRPHANSNASLSSSITTSHYQPIRPKRPESVLSIASNSSNRSFDINSTTHNNLATGNLPNSTNSSAFPPSGDHDYMDRIVDHSDNSDHTHHPQSSAMNTTASSIEDINAYQHFGRTGLGAIKDDFDHQVYSQQNLNFPETLSSTALSTSSSFVNMYGGVVLQLSKLVSPPLNSELPQSRSCSFLSNDNNGTTTKVVPPLQADFDYELDIPLLQEFFLQDLDRRREEDYLSSKPANYNR